MAFDPSPIGTIGERVTGPIADAPARAMTIADLMNKEQISKLGLKEEQETQATYEAIKNETQGMDWSNPDDQNKAIAIAAKHSPKVAMQMQREFTQQQAGQLSLTREELALHEEKNNLIASAIQPIWEQKEKLKAAGKSPQEIDAALLPVVTQTVNSLKGQTLRNGKPILDPNDMQNASQLLSGNLDAGLDKIAMSTQQSREAIAKHQERLDTAKRTEAEDRETKTVMKGGKPHLVLYKKTSGEELKDLGEAPPSAAMINLQAGKDASSPANASTIAAAATGMPLIQLAPGYGRVAGAERKALRDGAIAQIKAESNLSDKEAGQEYARRTIEFSAGKTSVAALNKMEGFTRSALAQLDFNVKKASEFMDKVPEQTDLSPVLNAIVTQKEKWEGNPNMAPLFMYMNAVAIETARLQSGGQASTAQLHQGAAEETKRWLEAGAITPASWKALAPEIISEGQNRLKNFQDAKEAMMPESMSTTPPADQPPAVPPPGGSKAGGAGAPKTVSWADLQK